jgi:hypothetical protein
VAYPKPDDERERRNLVPLKEATIIEVDDTEVVRGPSLKEALPGINWCETTLTWWETWRRAPQAKLMTDTDWESFYGAAVVHNTIFAHHTKSLSPNALAMLLSELRRREGQFGATFEDRQRLMIRLKTDQSDEEREARIKKQAKSAVNYLEMMNAEVAKELAED